MSSYALVPLAVIVVLELWLRGPRAIARGVYLFGLGLAIRLRLRD